MDNIKLGILGGGQLGRMLTMAAKRMGIPVTVLDPTPDCPAAQGTYRYLERLCTNLSVIRFSFTQDADTKGDGLFIVFEKK
jgi:5-(carboxyamino)imidazole ribonucleotide synthase